MIKGRANPIYLLITVLFLLSACGQQAVIQLPPDDPTATPAEAETEDPPEEASVPVETGLEDLLKAGTAMKWYDDGYIVFVPQGEVTLGDNEYENNLVHSVFVDDYWIYMFKVTSSQYRQCVATGACTAPADEAPYPDLNDPEIKDKPVIGVTWEQADTYCEWMNGRLPTKAEWEKAARGPQSNTYPWGEDEPTCDLLNYGECEDPAISEVYEYPEGRSFYQAFDLAGNTFEWVFDLYEDDFISQLPEEIPAGPPDGTERSVRGSDYESIEDMIPSAQLYYLEPEKYRTDLGFRCVLQGAEPKSFANPCIQTAFVPGESAPWQPGPPQAGNMLPQHVEGQCVTDIGSSITQYCANQPLQQGGLDLSIAALGADDVYVKSSSSNTGGVCIDGTDPLGCFGPEGASITFEICATCTPAFQVSQFQYNCDCFYDLSDTNPPTCIYNGGPPVQGETCPAGFVYDQVNDICVKVVQISEECPDGYEYNPDTDCCTATFAYPAPDPDTPSGSYLTCPPGYGSVTLVGEWVVQGQFYAICQYLVSSPQVESCITKTYTVGHCDEPKIPRCTNPGSYSDKASCEAAICKWVPAAARPGYCTFP
ncbi:MAG: SUMF1/EgtB/PvdO family nonheme iron enzyme [Chloroflexi bacterium]|nr:SUMF1/EgtB/PvdO family nonheme iron enzyme [Chloroflexota bacterium]